MALVKQNPSLPQAQAQKEQLLLMQIFTKRPANRECLNGSQTAATPD